MQGFPGISVVKSPLANAGDARVMSSISGSERSSGVGNGNPLQHSCLENSMDRGAWQAIVHGVTKSWTQKQLSTLALQVFSEFQIFTRATSNSSPCDLSDRFSTNKYYVVSHCQGYAKGRDISTWPSARARSRALEGITMDCSLPCFSVHGIFQAKVLEWGCHCLLQHTERQI